MIKNDNQILSQNIEKAECILKEFMKDVLKQEQEGKLTINTIVSVKYCVSRYLKPGMLY